MRAHHEARKTKKKGRAKKRAIAMVDSDVEGYCRKIQEMLRNKTFTTGKYHEFKIFDRGKERDICNLPYYPDRIVHWAIMLVLEPIFKSHFISQTYAAIRKKGTHKALKKEHEYMEDVEGSKYCLKLDVSKYFPHVDHDILKTLIRRKIKCRDTLWLLDDIIDSYHTGIPIGNLTSQYFGNFYLSSLDHWIKEQKREKYYLRYMDDIMIFHKSKVHLNALVKEIELYITETLKLNVKGNWQVFPVDARGADFVGYRSFRGYTLLRKKTKKRLKAAVKRLRRKIQCGKQLTRSDQCVIGSYKGILGWGSCKNLERKTLQKIKELINDKKHTQRAAA